MPARTAHPSAPSARRKIAFVATEDWFFASHFLPMARAAVEMGLDVVVVARVRHHADEIAATGARVVGLEAERRSLNPFAAAGAALRLAGILRREKPDIVHCIALKGILVGGAACVLAGIERRVYALTGLGFLGAREDKPACLARRIVRGLVRGALESPGTRYLFENEDDPRLIGLDPGDAGRVCIVGGAGVDPDALTPAPLPPSPPLRVALVARMLWSKGIDLAVEAVTRARARGADVVLDLYGAPDPSNPKAIPEATLRAWSGLDGVAWHGPTRDIVGVWATHQVALLPSRGGEGLPRTLLEAAACGRAIITADVPGCRTLVRQGIEGVVAPAGDVEALADALVHLSQEPDRVAAMGAAARARVLDGFTERAVMDAVKRLYADMLR